MGTFMTHIPRCVYLGIGVIMGSVIKSARTVIGNCEDSPLDTSPMYQILEQTDKYFRSYCISNIVVTNTIGCLYSHRQMCESSYSSLYQKA